MSRVLLVQPSSSCCASHDLKCTAHGGLSILSDRHSNVASLHARCSLSSANPQLRQCESASQALACRKVVKIGRKMNRMRFHVGTQIVAAGSRPSDRIMKSNSKTPPLKEKTTSHRPDVVRNAAPTAMASASGLLIPPSIVGSEHEDLEDGGSPILREKSDGKYSGANLLTQLLIQKKQKVVKKKRAERAAETAEGEVAANSRSLESASPLSSSANEYESTLVVLIDQLQGIRLQALALERWHAPLLKKTHRQYLASARNLLHYVAFRSLDIADLQETLASSGFSSLEGCEAHIMASVNSISSILRSLLHASQLEATRFGGDECDYRLTPPSSPTISVKHINGHARKPSNAATAASDDVRTSYRNSSAENSCAVRLQDVAQDMSFQAGNSTLSNNAETLLGPSPPGRKALVMVTLPSEAAEDDVLIRNLFKAGMNVARVNCAHDGPEVWKSMIQKVRFFSQLLETPCRVMMDLAGPKLRTGPMQPGPSVLKIKPAKDGRGDVVTPACVWLAGEAVKPSDERTPDACVPIVPTPRWAKKIQIGDVIKFKDARGRARELRVIGKGRGASRAGIWAECQSSAYIDSGTELVVSGHGGKKLKVNVGQLPEVEQAIVLRAGDKLVLKREFVLGRPAQMDKTGKVVTPATVMCTLEQVFDMARPGEPVKFDDGKIGGVISNVSPTEICVNITEAGDHKGRKLRGEKAINFPESGLSVEGLTAKDAGDLDFVAAHADIVALSFVNGPADVRTLQEELARRGAEKLGVVMKIETELGFQRLPSILLQAMEAKNPVGVMVARGDMAVECGWQRLAEIQDQILLICEASHVPTIWATQVLEGLAKSGLPSRPEITDAASGSRAECVMLNKGPHILEAVASLDDILRREACHRRKNQSVLHPLQHLQNLGM